MKRDIQCIVQQVVYGAFRVKEVMCRFRHMCDSQILSDLPHHDQILSLLPKPSTGKQVTLEILYRASRDGWQCQDFHSRCDNKGATVTVIKCTGGFVFGGYADAPWDCPLTTSYDSRIPSPVLSLRYRIYTTKKKDETNRDTRVAGNQYIQTGEKTDGEEKRKRKREEEEKR